MDYIGGPEGMLAPPLKLLGAPLPPPPPLFLRIWRKSHRSQITLSAEGISYNIARQVKLTPDAFGSLRHVRRILQVAAFEKCPQARKKDEALLHDYDLCQY